MQAGADLLGDPRVPHFSALMRIPPILRTRLNRERVASVLSPTFARIRNLEPNEGYTRLEVALLQPGLLEPLQSAAWVELQRLRPGKEPDEVVAWLDKRQGRPKRFQPAPIARRLELSWLAWTMRIDRAAGKGTGEAADLLETPEGREFETEGAQQAGFHLAREISR